MERRGRFAIPVSSLDTPAGRKFALKVLEGMIVVRCEMMYDSFAFIYTAISDKFPEVRDGDATPFYYINRETGKIYDTLEENNNATV